MPRRGLCARRRRGRRERLRGHVTQSRGAFQDPARRGDGGLSGRHLHDPLFIGGPFQEFELLDEGTKHRVVDWSATSQLQFDEESDYRLYYALRGYPSSRPGCNGLF